MTFDIETVSDAAYFPDYGYLDRDRLESQVTISRARRDAFIRGSFYNFESLRDGDINDNLPTVVLDGEYERRFFPDIAVGGEVRLNLQAHAHRRNSDLDVDGADDDLIVDGRDVARLHGEAKWIRRLTHPLGLVTDLEAGVSFNIFNISQDASFAQNPTDILGQAAVALRYPMIRRSSAGVVQMLEPVVQLGWTSGSRLAVPNEESSRVEFDQGNLLSLSRFARPDRRERGRVMAVGINWARFDPAGWDTHVTVGQVVRQEADDDFTISSGLCGSSSHYLVAGQLQTPNCNSFTGRCLVEDGLQFG